MRNRFSIFLITITVLGATFLAACSGEDEAPVEFRETPVLVGQERYALVTEEYARFHQGPNIEAPVITHGRAGDVLEVLGSTADRQWTEIQASAGRGWIQSIHIRRFSNRRQAVNAGRLLDDSDRFQ